MSDITAQTQQRLYRAGQVRELDRLAIEHLQITGMELMERAGKAAWECLRTRWPAAKNIVVVCGAGNNGGDGYIIARLAAEHGCDVRVLTLVEPGKLTGDARHAADQYIQTGNPVAAFSVPHAVKAEVIVDAVFGTGLDRDVAGKFLEAIVAINASGVPVMSVDIPSGLNADTGKVMGAAVRADLTITFIGRKQGMYTGEGREYSGDVSFSDLGVPTGIHETIEPASSIVDLATTLGLLPTRKRSGHKGDYGHVLVVGGDYGFAGAVQMCATGAARTGAGLTSVATRQEHAVLLPVARPEIMAAGVHRPAELVPLLQRASVIAVGPGLGQSDWSASLFAKVLDTDLPLVIDADGLNLLAQDPCRRDNWILTPHPGEAARLLTTGVDDIQADRFAASRALQEKYGGTIVLKGSGSIITAGDGCQFVCTEGNPGMASGGMGDVLTGVIAGLQAQGLTPDQATCLGVSLHAHAADRVAAACGERGMLATDLLPWIQRLLNP